MIIEMSWLYLTSLIERLMSGLADQCSLCITLDTVLTRAEGGPSLRLMMFG